MTGKFLRAFAFYLFVLCHYEAYMWSANLHFCNTLPPAVSSLAMQSHDWLIACHQAGCWLLLILPCFLHWMTMSLNLLMCTEAGQELNPFQFREHPWYSLVWETSNFVTFFSSFTSTVFDTFLWWQCEKTLRTKRSSASPSPRSGYSVSYSRITPSSAYCSSPPPVLRSTTPSRRSSAPLTKPSSLAQRSLTPILRRMSTGSSGQAFTGRRGTSPVKTNRGSSASPKLHG